MIARTSTSLFSCLCVTENRPAFMPWLLWNFEKQTWPHRELVVVDSSAEPLKYTGPLAVRVIPAPPGSTIPHKRNLALKAARGTYITWFDDDDWQHPEKCALLADALSDGTPYAGSRQGWFVDLATGQVSPYRLRQPGVIFNSAGFRHDLVQNIPFPEKIRRGSDSRWLGQIKRQAATSPKLIEHPALFFWLVHDDNISNPRRRRPGREPQAVVRQAAGPGWGDTDNALKILGRNLGKQDTDVSLKSNKDAIKPQILGGKNGSAPAPTPPVSLMIKATVLDVPYLSIMVRHMIRQARFNFAEKVLIVERLTKFLGKYSDRTRASEEAFTAVIKTLIEDGLIDRAVEVDSSPAVRRKILTRYFGPQGEKVPTHATSGGPIYATLFGLEQMHHDLVVQMDADIYFFSDGQSWVKEGLTHLKADPDVWLVMTHPGPPAGPMGRSLRGSNARRAIWDPARQIWRFRTATTRYFLCDRRRLRGRVVPVWRAGGCAPLEQCLSAGMGRHGGWRVNLGQLGSWHLHAWSHEAPFPAWAGEIATAVEKGSVPFRQLGHYDLRLERPAERAAWRALLDDAVLADSDNPDLSETEPRTQPRTLPLAVIIPVRDRANERLANTLHSLTWQSAGRAAQIIVVSHGSRAAVNRELEILCRKFGADLKAVGHPQLAWNKPQALNIGIRHADPTTRYIMTMDADMILSPNFLESVMNQLVSHPTTLVLCRSTDLPENAMIPPRPQLEAHFESLRRTGTLRSRMGTGGIQAAPRRLFFDIRGYDEDLLWWGAMDTDLVMRAELEGYRVVWIENHAAMLHQWHPKKYRILRNARQVTEAQASWKNNHQIMKARSNQSVRNPTGWGKINL